MTAARARLRTAAWVTVPVVLAACALGSRPPDVRYYTLTVPGTPRAQLPAPVRIGRFTAEASCATRRLAYRTSPYRLDYYVYHRWASDPGSLVAAAARDFLDRGAPAAGGPPLEISGHVRRLEEVDEPAGWQAALGLDVEVRRDGRAVLARPYLEAEPTEARNPEAVAAALSRALGRVLDRVVVDLVAASRAERPGGAR